MAIFASARNFVKGPANVNAKSQLSLRSRLEGKRDKVVNALRRRLKIEQ